MPGGSDEQLTFLLKCVKYSSNGKVDFDQVARECNIVTKGAAAKRYERLMKANGINPNCAPAAGPDVHSPQEPSFNRNTPKKSTPKTPTKGNSTTGTKTPSTRKRKTIGQAKGTPKKIKREKLVGTADYTDKSTDSNVQVKREDSSGNTFEESEKAMMRFGNDPLLSEGSGVVEGNLGREDRELYSQFCAINTACKQRVLGGSGENGNSEEESREYNINGAEKGVLGMLDGTDEE
ncbi:hypothetical protein ACJ73_00964 [Blastomyces percursus]|uniref:Myb-like DNA-binding domain-containing protein n=1 Tax=Blastomyces percursus TaxID=1658174 RepID=A0A1J9RGD1_9EURO|nr:hypothetical protein ACJ73_00964 [Blastomyces percursus]